MASEEKSLSRGLITLAAVFAALWLAANVGLRVFAIMFLDMRNSQISQPIVCTAAAIVAAVVIYHPWSDH